MIGGQRLSQRKRQSKRHHRRPNHRQTTLEPNAVCDAACRQTPFDRWFRFSALKDRVKGALPKQGDPRDMAMTSAMAEAGA